MNPDPAPVAKSRRPSKVQRLQAALDCVAIAIMSAESALADSRLSKVLAVRNLALLVLSHAVRYAAEVHRPRSQARGILLDTLDRLRAACLQVTLGESRS